jgi:hypothetical protein
VKRLARLLPFLRASLLIVGGLAVALVLAYLVDRFTDRPAGWSSPTAGPAGSAATKVRVVSAKEAEWQRERNLYGHGYAYRHRIGTTMGFGDASMLCVFRSDFMSDFKREFGSRVRVDEKPRPSALLVVSEVLNELQLRPGRGGADASALATIVEFIALRMLPNHEEHERYWKPVYRYHQDAQGLWRIEQVDDYDERRDLTARREGREPDEMAFRDALRRIPKAYAFYFDSLTVGRSQAIGLLDELLRLPAEERRALEAVVKYRRARLTMHLEDWAILSDPEAKQRLAAIRADLESVPGHVREGSLDPALISENIVSWLAYTHSMILPAGRLIRMGEADFAGATATYLRMPMRDEANAVTSSFRLAQKLCKDKAFGPSAQDPDLRRIITMYLAAGGSDNADTQLGPAEARSCSMAWLDALAAAGVGHEFDPARLGMIEYAAHRWKDCLRTIALLPVDDPLRLLLASRCNLRLTDDLKVSRRLLDSSTHTEAMAGLNRLDLPGKAPVKAEDLIVFIEFEDKSEVAARVIAELGMTALSQGEFQIALGLFVEAGFTSEAEYVAECLLTTAELEAFVAEGMKAGNFGGRLGRDHVRMLLASRLFREGRMEEGLEHVRRDIEPKARSYVLLHRLAERTDLAQRTRADAYWRAALIIREIGDEILGAPRGLHWNSYRRTEQEWRYDYDFLPYLRVGLGDGNEHAKRLVLLAPVPQEIRLTKAWLAGHVDKPVRSERDARYPTFDLAIKAARLLPDNDPAGGEILQYAGNLLKYREPKAAVPAYRMLALRFPRTTYGQHAVEKRWFSTDRPEPSADIVSK